MTFEQQLYREMRDYRFWLKVLAAFVVVSLLVMMGLAV
jgi:hypothetical protein